ncbi:hypothetical protein C2E25_09615 [Geothermobacter hydrogeniphilus]|uniref:Lipopolysaccharide-assembly n=1 Tax=Geothermobacter hydrogeniphilus TaxID=1969733 RepID=A0A2K2H9P6_9BACT|nr:LptE family protein [Geothermobacter hydrogeniphilus]PNU20034.1 hypothetical protein C2E25_09615 [Geothermobacter hydrogeniphilus]
MKFVPVRALLLGALLLCLLAAGCGYRFRGQGNSLPGGVHSVYIEMFVNRTTEPFLENRLTNAVTRRFARKREVEVAARRTGAEAILSGEITAYETEPISYDRNDKVTEYRSIMTVAVVLSRLDSGKTLWKGTLTWSEEYLADADKSVQDDRELAAEVQISDRLSDEILAHLLENF